MNRVAASKALLALAVWAAGAGAACAESPPALPSREEAGVQTELLRRLNADRARAGAPELKVEPRLADAARAHARAMAERQGVQHVFEGEAGLAARVAATGLRFDVVAENISRTSQQDAAETAHLSFMFSPRHRENLLDVRHNSVGVGAVRRGDKFYIAEDFARAYPDMTPADMEQAVLGSFDRIRKQAGLGPLRRIAAERTGTCEQRARLDDPAARFVSSMTSVTFTVWDPERLPAPMERYATRPDLGAIAIEACPLPAPAGQGGFRISATLF